MAFDISRILSVLGYGLLILGGLSVLGFIAYQLKRRQQFKYVAEVYERDNTGQLTPYMDRFGLILDKKTNKEMGKLLNTKHFVGLENFNYQSIRKNKKHFRLVRLLRLGEGEYIFLRPKVHNPTGDFDLNVTREDVDWAINTYLACTKTYVFKDKFKEMLPMVLTAFALVIVLVVAIMLIKELPAISQQVGNMASALKQASSNLLQSQQIVGGVVA